MMVKRRLESLEKSGEEVLITEDEAALYDRQIRLWGLNCQKRLRDAKILIIGLNGLGLEVVKNLTLSGVKSVTIMDETPVSEFDSSAQYYVAGCKPGSTRAEASKSSIQELNPNVTIGIDKDSLDSKGPEFYAGFSVVFATGISLDNLVKVNKICHEQDVPFFCGESWGFYGYGFLDLMKHQCSKKRKVEDCEENVVVNLIYCTLESSLKCKFGSELNNKRTSNVYVLIHIMNHFQKTNNKLPSPSTRESDLELLKISRDAVVQDLNCDAAKVPDSLLECLFGELSPVCAAVGGIMANEIIKGISQQEEPINNFLFFDGEECTGSVNRIVSKD